MWTPNFSPPDGCGHKYAKYPDGTIHHTLYTPSSRRSWDELPDGRFVNDHIALNSEGITHFHGRQPFNTPYDHINPK